MKNILLRNEKVSNYLISNEKETGKTLSIIPLIFTYMQIFNKLKDIKYLGKNCFHKQVSATKLYKIKVFCEFLENKLVFLDP